MSNNINYEKSNTQGLYIKLNKKTDADIIELLTDIKNKQGYIKALIRDDIARSKVDVYATYPDYLKDSEG